MSEQNPGRVLTWRAMEIDPECDVLLEEVAWGVWPYRVLVYLHQAVVERFVPESPVRRTVVPRDHMSVAEMAAAARKLAQSWDKKTRQVPA